MSYIGKMNSIFFLTFILDKEYLQQYSCCKTATNIFVKKKFAFMQSRELLFLE